MIPTTITITPSAEPRPDVDTNVLLFLSDGTTCEGFLDDETWRDVTACPIEGAEVVGWAPMPTWGTDAAGVAEFMASLESAPKGRGFTFQGPRAVAMADCGNAKCNWRGPLNECSYLGAVGPCCPECREIVEPDTPGVEGTKK